MTSTVPLSLGLGTGKVDDREACIEMVSRALAAGYRHIDTAQGYENEAYVGEALEAASVDREAVVIATKVLQHNLAHDDVLRTVDESVDRLDVDTLDLLYVHWPTHEYTPAETLAAFDELYRAGRTEHVGVCNFTLDQLKQARELLDAPLSVYQVEHHPLFRPDGVVEYCQRHGIDVVGYSPLADGLAVDLPPITAIAEERNLTPGQVCLAWALAHDVTPIPKSTGAHIEENLAAIDVSLSPEEIERIDSIQRTERVYDPDWAPWNDAT